MANKYYIHPGDARLDRRNRLGDTIPVIDVYSSDGDIVLMLPGSLSDADVHEVLREINRIYTSGFRAGERSRSREFRALLADGVPRNDE